MSGTNSTAMPGGLAPATGEGPDQGSGPLLLFPDTSALLSMLGATGSGASGTPFTLHLLEVRFDTAYKPQL